MSNCHRLPGFAHFESPLNSSSSVGLCGFEQLDLRFASEEVGLPPPYPTNNNGLDLSNVNGLDLTSSQYEAGLNLTRRPEAGVRDQSEMVLNLSTQIGLNLTRTAAVGEAADINNYQIYNNSFDYYNTGYYDTTATVCQMEEQRCSPLNLEHRNSPLNLTAVPANVRRKRKPTPGQAASGTKQDFTINNQVYDYRVNNKLTAFYSQQEGGKCEDKNTVKPANSQPVGDFFSNVTSDIPLAGPLQYSQQSTSNKKSLSSCKVFPQASGSGSSCKNNSWKQMTASSSQLQDQTTLLGFDSGQSADFLFQEDYEDLNYTYSDALNFAAEAMAENSPAGQPQSRGKVILEMKAEMVNDLSLSTNKNTAATQYNCQTCMAQFFSSSDLSVHIEKHHKVSSLFSCSSCKINFYEESQLLTHNKLCHESVKVKTVLNAKIVGTDGQKRPVSKVGGSGSEDKQPMNMTLGRLTARARELDRKSKSNLENKYPKNKTQAEIEKLKEESAKEPFPFQCITCAKKFSDKTELLQHLEDHNEVKPFKCSVCHLGFTHLSAKKRHEKGHSGEKTHHCGECHRAFSRKSDLSQHLKTHGRESLKFACPDCAQVFRTEKRLRCHPCSACSPPVKQLQCVLCSVVLPSKVSWGVHMWKHTKDSSYILTSESDPWPVSLLDKLPRDLMSDLSLWTSELDNLQPLNMRAVPS